MTQDDPADATDSTSFPDEPANSDSIEESSPSTGQSLSRRTLLKGTASAAVGMTGLSAISGTAAAGWGKCNNLHFQQSPDWFGYINPGPELTQNHNVPWGTDELTIFIHGWQTDKQGALKYGHEVWRKLRDMGYKGAGISNLWWSQDTWSFAQRDANQAGVWLADFLVSQGWTQNNGVEINLICHSLGARVALKCLSRLHLEHNAYINTVNFLGGAIHDRLVGGYYRDNIYWGCNKLHNWFSANDDVLADLFRSVEGGRWAVGWKGIASGPVPENYIGHDKFFQIDQHCEYMHYHNGVIDEVYYTFN